MPERGRSERSACRDVEHIVDAGGGELRVLEDCRLSIISERRTHAPQGERGGGAGTPGRNTLNGEPLPAKATRDLTAGDVVAIETPGGGGHGR